MVLLTNATLTASSTTVTEHKDSLTLLCETQETAVTIHWFFQNHPLVLDAHMSLSDDDRNLTFTTVQRTDFGTYQCEIQNASHSLKSNIQNIVVNYGPDPFTITLDIENANWKMEEVPRGSHVTFSVNIQSYPPPNFTWTVPYNVEQPITTFRFSIPHITGKHSGTYRCVVSNLVTQLTHMDTLEIQVPDHLTPPSILVSSDFLVESDTGPPVNLTCRTNHTDLSVHWLLGGQPLQPNERLVLSTDNRTLAIYRLRRSDTGPYQCLVWDSTSEARSDPVHLDIYYGPDQVNISSSTQDMPRPVLEAALGSNLTLNCQTDAHPSPQYHWTSRNRTYATNQLVFEALTWEDDGVHTCTATNPQTGKSSSNSVVLRLGGPSPALSAGAIAGITVGVVAAIPATVGLLHLCGIIRVYMRLDLVFMLSREHMLSKEHMLSPPMQQ
ncbi:carcinoembryonic antigen-related cell adhesion molecule 20-like [Sorex araneus]|uniref:carcinoembryonic antigen-related cell adhesion molecule 20-like n=1 Tax=Sorex araneus TaxID=42254 RepID=UPI002433BBE2|nr:carcinoembryonic antigen-related cell adhesion molecule 20-like [Sorex araneus]